MKSTKQNQISVSLGRSLRDSKSIEDFALKAFMVLVPSVAVLALIINLVTGQSSLPITGRPSMAIFISLLSGLLTLALFIGLYRPATRINATEEYLTAAKKPALIFDAVSLGVVYSLIAIGITIVLERVMAASFVGLRLDIYTASAAIGLACAVMAYGVIRVVAAIDSKQIVNVLAFFLVAGVTISMITTTDPLWWEANFSTLGQVTQQYTASFYVFNLTLILSAFAIIVLARHLYADMRILIQKGSMLGVSKVNAVKTIFVVAALGLAGVGLFPYKPDSFQATMHVFSAGLIAIAFGALMILLKWLLPGLSKSFMTISYIALTALGSAYILFMAVGYLSLTAFELSCFAICFGWLYLFTQQIVNTRTQSTTNKRRAS